MISLLALLIRMALLLACTYAFVVLFEHGPSGFLTNLPIEYRHLVAEFSPVR